MSISRGKDKEDMAYARAHTHTHTHPPEYYSAKKRNEIWSFVETWVDLETQSDVSQKEKNRTSLVVPWIRIRLPMQGTQVPSLV